jgi:hypothetical protein
MARLARCLDTLRAQVRARYPNRNTSSDGWIGDAAHQAGPSDHNPGADGVVEAIDLTHDPANGFDSYKFSETLRLARDPRLEYVISNRRIFYAGGARPWEWQAYSGENPHSSHVHVSCQPDPAVYDNDAQWVIERANAQPGVNTDIVATVFGGPSDSMSGTQTAYGNLIALRWWERPGVALPVRFSDRPLPQVRVTNRANGRSVICPVIDVGPWNINDAYWRTGARPQAESGTDLTGRRTNLAGIDLTPAAAAAIGLNGKGFVDWEFVTQEQIMAEPTTAPALPATGTLQLDEPRLRAQLLERINALTTPQLLVVVLGLGPQALPAPAVDPAPAPAPAAPAPAAPSPVAAIGGLATLLGSGTKIGTIIGIGALLLQMLGGLPSSGLVGPGDATAVGNTVTAAAASAPVLGAAGLFQFIGRLFGR